MSAVHEPCREHCRAMVQLEAFRHWPARIKQRRPPNGERKWKGIPQTRSSTSSPGRLTKYPRAGGERSSASGTPSSSKSSEKTSSVRERCARSEFRSKFRVHLFAGLCSTAERFRTYLDRSVYYDYERASRRHQGKSVTGLGAAALPFKGGSVRQLPEVSDFVARFCTLR